MSSYASVYRPGRVFFANPGPTNIPESVLHASAHPSVDFMDEDFTANVYQPCFEGLKRVLKTKDGQIFMYASSGAGAWEACLVNLLSAGDKILVCEGGFFGTMWGVLARNLHITTEMFPCPLRSGVNLDDLRARLRADSAHELKAVCVVHNETATGVAVPLKAIREVLDEVGHPALFLVDTISSLASVDFRMDEWGIDGVVGGGQKGLMLPTGLGFTCASPKAMAASATSTLPKFYFNWTNMSKRAPHFSFAGTIPTHMIFALRESLRLIEAEGGVDAVLERHARLAEGVRRCVAWWGRGAHNAQLEGAPELFCEDAARRSNSVTGVVVPGEGMPAKVKKVCLQMGVSIGLGIGSTGGKIIRIGHLGDNNEASILAVLGTVEAALSVCGVPHHHGGVTRAIEYYADRRSRMLIG